MSGLERTPGLGGRFDFDKARERLARAAEEQRTPAQERELLEWRARELAAVEPEPDDQGDALDVVRFALGGERFAVAAERVLEAIPIGEPTPVPGAADVLIGLLNHRGRVLPVLDLRRVLNTADQGELTHVVAVTADGGTFGIAAEAVEETARERITDPLLTLLDAERLAADPRLRIDE